MGTAWREQSWKHEIEAYINSRPLTFVSDDPDQEKPLTPSHFLLGHDHHYLSESSEPTAIETADDARRRFGLRQSVVDKFWVVWNSEYLQSLPPWRGVSQGHTLREESMVLVEADHRPRLYSGHWASSCRFDLATMV